MPKITQLHGRTRFEFTMISYFPVQVFMGYLLYINTFRDKNGI